MLLHSSLNEYYPTTKSTTISLNALTLRCLGMFLAFFKENAKCIVACVYSKKIADNRSLIRHMEREHIKIKKIDKICLEHSWDL